MIAEKLGLGSKKNEKCRMHKTSRPLFHIQQYQEECNKINANIRKDDTYLGTIWRKVSDFRNFPVTQNGNCCRWLLRPAKECDPVVCFRNIITTMCTTRTYLHARTCALLHRYNATQRNKVERKRANELLCVHDRRSTRTLINARAHGQT